MAETPPCGQKGVPTGSVAPSLLGRPRVGTSRPRPQYPLPRPRLGAAPTREGYAPGSRRPRRPPQTRCPWHPSGPCPTLPPEPARPSWASLVEQPSAQLRTPAPCRPSASLRATSETLTDDPTQFSREPDTPSPTPTRPALGREGRPQPYALVPSALPRLPRQRRCLVTLRAPDAVPAVDEIR